MTPEWASQILSQNTHNRKLSNARVELCVALIAEGKWKLTHQGIAIDSNNVLQDGQHRLHAIAKSGIAVPIMLSTGCDPSNFDVIDIGKKRTTADILSLCGAKNAALAGAGIKGYIQYRRFPGKVWTGQLVLIDAFDVRQFYSENPAVVGSISTHAKASYDMFKKQNTSAAVSFALIAREHGLLSEALKFIELIGTGAGLETYNPILTYRNFLANDRIRRPLQVHLAANIKYFNKWMNNESVRCFKMPDVAPMPIITISRPATAVCQ